MRLVASLVLLSLVGMAGLGCSGAPAPTTLDEISSGVTTSLSGYFHDEYDFHAGDGPAPTPEESRKHFEDLLREVKVITAAFDKWSLSLDQHHASGSLRLPDGVTWEDADGYRHALGAWLADEAEVLTDELTCGTQSGDAANYGICTVASTDAIAPRWTADHDAMVEARAKAGLACIQIDFPCPEDRQ
jgi:hypothetical protein